MMCPYCQYQFFVRNSLTCASNISSDSGFYHYDEGSNASTISEFTSNSNFESFENGITTNNNKSNIQSSNLNMRKNKLRKKSCSIKNISTCCVDKYCECSLSNNSQLYRNVNERWSDGRIQQKKNSYLARKRLKRPTSNIAQQLKNSNEVLCLHQNNLSLKATSLMLSKSLENFSKIDNKSIESKTLTEILLNKTKKYLFFKSNDNITKNEMLFELNRLNKRLLFLKNSLEKFEQHEYINKNFNVLNKEYDCLVNIDDKLINSSISKPILRRFSSKILKSSTKFNPASRHSTSSLSIKNITEYQVFYNKINLKINLKIFLE